MSLETALELERDEGARLLAALRDPLGGLATYGRGAGEREVKAWTANVKHLLRDDPERLALFEWEPLTPLGSFMQSLVLSVSGQDQTRRMEHRLAQLDKVIAEL